MYDKFRNDFSPDIKVVQADKTPPEAWVKKIDQLGVVTVAFTKLMFQPYYETLTEQYLDLEDSKNLNLD